MAVFLEYTVSIALDVQAYEKFGVGIRQTKRELEECLTTGVFPGMSPPRDAPSPDASEDLNIEEVLKGEFCLIG